MAQEQGNGEEKAFKFARVKDKEAGIGVFACRAIKRGEMILREEPILTASMDTLDGRASALDETSRRRLFSLCDWGATREGRQKTVLGIFQSNGYPCGEEAGVFFAFSRFNHSCTPNASHAWRDGRRCVFATRDVAENEELCTNYIDITAPAEKRREMLRDHFGFDCVCDACLDPERTDPPRAEIARLDVQIFDHVRGGRYDAAVAAADRRIALLRTQGLDAPAQLVRTGHDIVQAMDHAGDRGPRAAKWLAFVLDHSRLCEPPDSPEIRDIQAKLRALRVPL